MKRAIRLLFVLGFIVFIASCSENAKKESALVGRWRVIDYADNMQRVDTEMVAYQANVEAFKRMIFVLNDDKSYSRTLDTQADVGKWSLSEDGKKLITTPTVQNAPKMEMNIESLETDKFVLVIQEAIDLQAPQAPLVTTKITFGRLK